MAEPLPIISAHVGRRNREDPRFFRPEPFVRGSPGDDSLRRRRPCAQTCPNEFPVTDVCHSDAHLSIYVIFTMQTRSRSHPSKSPAELANPGFAENPLHRVSFRYTDFTRLSGAFSWYGEPISCVTLRLSLTGMTAISAGRTFTSRGQGCNCSSTTHSHFSSGSGSTSGRSPPGNSPPPISSSQNATTPTAATSRP